MTTRLCRSTLRLSATVALLTLWTAGCQSELFELQQCPAVSYGAGTLYAVGDSLTLGADAVQAEFVVSESTGAVLYGAHALAVPPAGDVNLRIELDLDAGGTPAIYIYGPRTATGTFGPCAAQRSGKVGDFSLSFTVEADQGGEYLVVVGRNPIALASGGYSVRAICEGDGCESPSCPVTFGTCDTEVCPSGFAIDPTVTDDGTVLDCGSCRCEEPSCGPFQRLVYDTCVCDCQVPLNPEAVCGEDGRTYQTECFAACEGVRVGDAAGACEDVCEPLDGCDLECTDGFALVDGCPVCACNENPCQGVTATPRPVCGTDGLTYTNREILACSTLGQGIGVAYMGHCLPYCTVPECSLSCEYGYRPTLEVPPNCFSCDCQVPANSEDPEQTCQPGDNLACSRPSDALLASLAAPESRVERLARFRTFVDECAAEDSDWQTLLVQACPSGLCEVQEDCGVGRQVFAANLDRAGVDGAALLAEGKVSVGCAQGTGGLVQRPGVCVLNLPDECVTDDDCLPNQTCTETNNGRECRSGCSCLNNVAGRVYDPVCTMTSAGIRTSFNACVAYCLSERPLYPGACCETRMTNEQRRAHLDEVQSFCGTLGDGFEARVRIDTACPPSVEECTGSAEANALCCRQTGGDG